MNSKVYSIFLFLLYTNCVNGQSSAYTPLPTDAVTGSYGTAPGITVVNRVLDENDVDKKEGLIIIGNAESNLVGWFNISGDAAIVIDLNHNLIGLVNASNPSEVVIDVVNRNGVHVPDPNPTKVIEETGREYLSSLKNGLKPFLSQENAIEFKLDDVPPRVLRAINQILSALVDDISEELERNPEVGLEFVLAAGKELLRLQELEGIVPILGIEGVSIRGDLVRSTNIIKGLVELYGRVPGVFPALVEAGANIHFQNIANSRNGLQSLAEVLREIGVKDVGKILGDLLNDPKSLLSLIRLLGGNSSNGVNGVLKVVAAVAVFAKGDSSLEYVINVVIQFLAVNSENDNDPEDILSELKQGISEVLETIDDTQSSDSLSEAVKVLRSLEEGTLIINRINISSLISRLISTINKPKELQIIVNVLLDLREVIEIKESLPRLLLVLILNVNSPFGIKLLERIGVSIDIDASEISEGIIEHILKLVSNITSRLLEDLYEGLRSVAAFERIIDSINSAISECGSHENLRDLLVANEAVGSLIKAILQVVGGLNLEATADTCSRARESVETCSSIKFYASIDVNVTSSG